MERPIPEIAGVAVEHDFVDAGGLRVRCVHPGVGESELRAATGFPLGDLSAVPTTPDPTDDELEVLRGAVDPNAILLPPVAAAVER